MCFFRSQSKGSVNKWAEKPYELLPMFTAFVFSHPQPLPVFGQPFMCIYNYI